MVFVLVLQIILIISLMTKLFIRFLFVISLTLTLLSSCDNNKEVVVSIDKSDSLKINNLLDSLKNNYESFSDSINYLSDEIEHQINNIVEINNYPYLYNRIGQIHYSKSQFNLAKEYFIKTKNAFLSRNDSLEAAKQTANIGAMHEATGNYVDAISNYLYALEIFENRNEQLFSSLIYNNIGIVYQKMGYPKKAIKYYKESYKIKTDNNKLELASSSLVNIGTVYEELLENTDSALQYYIKSENICKALNDSINLAIVQNNIGNIHLINNDFDSASYYFQISQETFNKYNNIDGKANVNKNIGKLLLAKGKYNESIIILNNALDYAKSIGDKKNTINILPLLSRAYSKQDNYKESNKILLEYQQLKDSILRIENQESINQLEVKYKVKEKNNKITILELETNVKDKRILILIAALSIILIISLALFVLFRLYRKNKNLEIKQMRYDISDYISQIEEIKEDATSITEENLIDRLKKFDLSKKEEEVLILISKGFKNAEIADKMFISINTVKSHTKNIFVKLDVRNRIEAVNKTQIL